jgi:hypothetical protein
MESLIERVSENGEKYREYRKESETYSRILGRIEWTAEERE